MIALVTQTQAVLEARQRPAEVMASLFAGKSTSEQEELLEVLERAGAGLYRQLAASEADTADPRGAAAVGRARGSERRDARAHPRALVISAGIFLPTRLAAIGGAQPLEFVALAERIEALGFDSVCCARPRRASRRPERKGAHPAASLTPPANYYTLRSVIPRAPVGAGPDGGGERMGILDGKAAVVTGGGRGIGRGHCLHLARARRRRWW